MSLSPITSHILDTARGCPAANILVSLKLQKENEWIEIAQERSNKDGRLNNLLSSEHELLPGQYKICFHTKNYFSENNMTAFYPLIEVIFEIRSNTEHYHIPLLLSPFGYSTYRGS